MKRANELRLRQLVLLSSTEGEKLFKNVGFSKEKYENPTESPMNLLRRGHG